MTLRLDDGVFRMKVEQTMTSSTHMQMSRARAPCIETRPPPPLDVRRKGLGLGFARYVMSCCVMSCRVKIPLSCNYTVVYSVGHCVGYNVGYRVVYTACLLEYWVRLTQG